MRISIAMATYNGEKYLQEQLDSFLNQTRLPDELVISDDCSTDNTLQILENFAQSAPFDVKIYQNDHNLGFTRNFENVLKKTSGDIIFLSDQDDIWFSNKIEFITDFAQQNEQYLLYINDAEICLADGTPTGLTKLNQTLALGLPEKDFTTGCCMAIRKKLKDIALPIPKKRHTHDTWLNRLSQILVMRKVIPVVLQLYRRHGENNSDWIASRTKKQTRFDLLIYKLMYKANLDLHLEQLDDEANALKSIISSELLTESMKTRVIQAINEIEAMKLTTIERIRIRSMQHMFRLKHVVKLILSGDYRYYSGWQSAIKDLLF